MAQYDVAIIGAGPGGYVASIRAGQLGLKTVCIEKDPRLGGTCTLRGCIPTKAILHTADLYENAQDSADQGVKVAGVELDMANVVKHKESVVTKSSKGVEFLFRKNKVDRVQGHARLAGPGRISVSGGSSGDQMIEAQIVRWNGSKMRLNPRFPQWFEIRTTFQAGHQIDANRRHAKLDERAGFAEVVCRITRICSKETLQCTQYLLCICGSWINEDVEVFSGSRTSVICDGVSSDDQVPYSLFV